MSVGHERPIINIMNSDSNEYEDWYGSAHVRTDNAFDLPQTPTTITNDSPPQNLSESYTTFAQNPDEEQAFNGCVDNSQQMHQMVIRAATVVEQPLVSAVNHRRSTSGSEGAMHDLFSPTEGRECVNCGK